MRDKLIALRENRILEGELYQTLHELGASGFTAAEPEVAKFLTHDKPQLRYIAIHVLGLQWDMKAYRHVFEDMMLKDVDENVRRVAASALGYLLRETKDRGTLRLLVKKVRQKEENIYVRETAYWALQDIWFEESIRAKQWRKQALESLSAESAHLGEIKQRLARGEDFEDPIEHLKEELEKRIDWALLESIERELKE